VVLVHLPPRIWVLTGPKTAESYLVRPPEVVVQSFRFLDPLCVILTSTNGAVARACRAATGTASVCAYSSNSPHAIAHFPALTDPTWLLFLLYMPSFSAGNFEMLCFDSLCTNPTHPRCVNTMATQQKKAFCSLATNLRRFFWFEFGSSSPSCSSLESSVRSVSRHHDTQQGKYTLLDRVYAMVQIECDKQHIQRDVEPNTEENTPVERRTPRGISRDEPAERGRIA
jgi:hypothetical protein